MSFDQGCHHAAHEDFLKDVVSVCEHGNLTTDFFEHLGLLH